MNLGRRNESPLGLVLLVALTAAASLPARAEDDPSSVASSDEEISRLRAYGAALLHQLETLRADLAASEQARRKTQDLLEATSRRLQGEISARRARDAAQARRREQAVAAVRRELESARANAARQAARTTELERTTEALRRAIDKQESDRRKLEAEIAALQRARDEAARAQADRLARRERDLKQIAHRLAEIERERDATASELLRRRQQLAAAQREAEALKSDRQLDRSRIDELDRQLDRMRAAAAGELAVREKLASELRRLTREREHASRKAAATVQKAVREEQQASRSRLEALQSVLRDTRSAGADLRTELDDAKQRNAALSREVTDLQASARKVHKLQTALRQKELRLQELAHGHDADAAEIRELRALRGSIESDLREAKSERVARAESLTRLTAASADAPVGPAPTGTPDPDPDDAELREQLSLERERRETLEREIQRLTTSGGAEEKFDEVWKALQSARSEILLLGNQLAEERRSRESLEVALGRVRQESGGESPTTNDFAERLARTLSERRAEADRLAKELQNANEVIVRLKGRLEASESPANEGKVLAELDQENQRLRAALQAAAEANRMLKDKAELAQRLAEMVYGKMR